MSDKKLKENLDLANKLNREIRELKDFIYCIDPIQGRDKRNGVFIKTKTSVELSLLGIRDFNIGRHVNEIKIPYSILPFIKFEANRILEEKIKKLKSIIGKEITEEE
jgi:hypothetical protein